MSMMICAATGKACEYAGCIGTGCVKNTGAAVVDWSKISNHKTITALSTQPSVADEVKVLQEALVEPVARAICKAVRPFHNPDDYQTDERKLWQWFEAQARTALRLAKDCKDE